jgi:hypothetical protein
MHGGAEDARDRHSHGSGALRGDVFWMVLEMRVGLTAVGIAAGLMLSAAATRRLLECVCEIPFLDRYGVSQVRVDAAAVGHPAPTDL